MRLQNGRNVPRDRWFCGSDVTTRLPLLHGVITHCLYNTFRYPRLVECVAGAYASQAYLLIPVTNGNFLDLKSCEDRRVWRDLNIPKETKGLSLTRL